MKKLLLLLTLLPLNTHASDAVDITSNSSIKLNGYNISNQVIDNNYKSYINLKNTDKIEIQSKDNIKGIYIIYEFEGYDAEIMYNNTTETIGKNNFAHEYIELKDSATNVTITYKEDAIISDIYLFTEGNLPSWVQKWENPHEEADLMLLTTHADDEQLFFLGLIPTYVDRGIKVQVVYLANHNDNQRRIHEQLNGLWTVGSKNYPVLGVIPDAYSESLEGAINNLNKVNLDEEFVIKFQTEMIRRFKPLVIVGHDELGEYSHGQHILNTYALKKALERSNDENYYNELNYDLWEVKKTYLHLYKDNQITMNYDTPLNSFDNKTAYEVSKEGYKMHESQQWTWFTGWINGKNNEYTKSTEITKYSPNSYGLYMTKVGDDIKKNDMFENIILRKEKKKTFKDIVNKRMKKKDIIDEKRNYSLYIISAGLLVTIILLTMLKTNKKKK